MPLLSSKSESSFRCVKETKGFNFGMPERDYSSLSCPLMLEGVTQMYHQKIILGSASEHYTDAVFALKRQPKMTTSSSSPPVYLKQEPSNTLPLMLPATQQQ